MADKKTAKPADEEVSGELMKVDPALFQVTATDPKEATKAILQRIADAETLEEILGLHESKSADDLIDRPIVIMSADFRDAADEFKAQGGFPYYAVVQYFRGEDYKMDTGETVGKPKTATMGGANVVMQLGKVKELAAFPFRAKLIEKKTSRGFNVYWLANA